MSRFIYQHYLLLYLFCFVLFAKGESINLLAPSRQWTGDAQLIHTHIPFPLKSLDIASQQQFIVAIATNTTLHAQLTTNATLPPLADNSALFIKIVFMRNDYNCTLPIHATLNVNASHLTLPRSSAWLFWQSVRLVLNSKIYNNQLMLLQWQFEALPQRQNETCQIWIKNMAVIYTPKEIDQWFTWYKAFIVTTIIVIVLGGIALHIYKSVKLKNRTLH